MAARSKIIRVSTSAYGESDKEERRKEGGGDSPLAAAESKWSLLYWGVEPSMIADIALHREELQALCRRFHVQRSTYSARQRVAISIRRKNFLGLKQSLETLFGRSVDLVESSAVRNPYVKASIERSREPVFAA